MKCRDCPNLICNIILASSCVFEPCSVSNKQGFAVLAFSHFRLHFSRNLSSIKGTCTGSILKATVEILMIRRQLFIKDVFLCCPNSNLFEIISQKFKDSCGLATSSLTNHQKYVLSFNLSS